MLVKLDNSRFFRANSMGAAVLNVASICSGSWHDRGDLRLLLVVFNVVLICCLIYIAISYESFAIISSEKVIIAASSGIPFAGSCLVEAPTASARLVVSEVGVWDGLLLVSIWVDEKRYGIGIFRRSNGALQRSIQLLEKQPSLVDKAIVA